MSCFNSRSGVLGEGWGGGGAGGGVSFKVKVFLCIVKLIVLVSFLSLATLVCRKKRVCGLLFKQKEKKSEKSMLIIHMSVLSI